ncbi:DUF2169 domain-containing protein [Sorangium sp. So ce1014]|uniref:DUF2169 family type VI secretion system accessory protein n=1 Tax=Sorangium sp. So ce1014 TaxID=3133326 RepID=UPI003F5DB246
MRTKNTTDLLFGAKVTSRRPPRPEMTLVVRGTFALRHGAVAAPLDGIPQIVQGPLQAETFRDGDDERLGDCLYPGDFADFKLRADVLLAGKCHAPGGRPVRAMDVRFSVGSWSKALRVTGRRVWTEHVLGPAMSEPAPFVEMPIDWTGAFGGPGYAKNPAGRGIGPGELPTVEDPRFLVRSRDDRPEPAGFGPINPAWPQRAGKMGKEYGASYRRNRAPYFAEDFDWSFFNAALADQQLPYLRGDEEVSFHGLHPAHAVYTSRLPGLRVRAFVKDRDGAFREVKMVLDTLFAEMEAERIVLSWRGLTEVRDDDLSDITFALVAAEPLAERPLPEDHYRAQLEAFEADPLGFKDMSPQLAEAVARGREIEAAQKRAVEPGADPLDALLEQKLAPLAPDIRAQIRKRIDDAIANAPPGTDMRARILELLSGAPDDKTPPPVMPAIPGAKPRISLRDALKSVREAVAKARTRAQQNHATPEDLSLLAQAEALWGDARLRELDPTLREPSPEEPGPGRDLSGQDLAGRDLRGRDLRGAKLDGAILTGASLQGARLTGASLKGAVLFEANLLGADLTQCNLELCNGTHALLEGAILEGASLEQACFKGAILREADLRRAHGQFVCLPGADLTRARLGGARISRADFEGAVLEAADLTEAEITRSVFRDCRAARSFWARACLGGSSFMGSSLEEANLIGIRADGSIWTGALLRRADFRLAHLRAAHFTEAIADEARFYGADLAEARFYRTSLLRAGFARANLSGAELNKARLDGARLPGANLYDAKLLGAAVRGCDWSGANLERARFEHA